MEEDRRDNRTNYYSHVVRFMEEDRGTTVQMMYEIIGLFMEEDTRGNSRNDYSVCYVYEGRQKRNLRNDIWYYWQFFVKKTEVTTAEIMYDIIGRFRKKTEETTAEMIIVMLLSL